MLMKQSQLRALDTTGVGWVRAFHLYGGSKRKRLLDGGILKGAITDIAYIVRRARGAGKKIKRLRVGHRVRVFITQVRYPTLRHDLSRCVCLQNGGVLIRRRGLTLGRNCHGPILKTTRRRRYISLFKNII